MYKLFISQEWNIAINKIPYAMLCAFCVMIYKEFNYRIYVSTMCMFGLNIPINWAGALKKTEKNSPCYQEIKSLNPYFTTAIQDWVIFEWYTLSDLSITVDTNQ